MFKENARGGTLYARVEEVSPGDPDTEFRLRQPVNQPQRLTFGLEVLDPAFANYTSLPLRRQPKAIFYFSNLTANEDQALFLHQPLPTFTAGSAYPAGSLLRQGGDTLEARRDLDDAGGSPAAGDWETFPGSQYASALDQLPTAGETFWLELPAADPSQEVLVELRDATGRKPWGKTLTVEATHVAGEPWSTSLAWGALTPGRYQLLVDGTAVDAVVILHPQRHRNLFALVEWVLGGAVVPAAFRALEAVDDRVEIRPQTYVIRFKNRATRWRYRYQQPHGFTAGQLGDFELIDDRTYASTQAIGLRQRPDTLLQDGNNEPLPAPDVGLIKPETGPQQQVTDIFSDVYL